MKVKKFRFRSRIRPNSKPVIGITCEVNKLKPYFSQFELACDYRYVRAVIRAGGIPLLLPVNLYGKDVDRLLKGIGGIVIVGGDDIHPMFYRERVGRRMRTAYRGRIYFEARLLQSAQKKRMPVLAICYGMQLVNVVNGGTLYQDIKREFKRARMHNSKDNPMHYVKSKRGSLCRKIFKEGSFIVNSEHHQAVKVLGRSLQIGAYAEDGVIEAIEKVPNIIAVQWHPERQPKDKVQQRLFRYFVNMARGRRKRA